jgi:hypothetical protein
MTMVDHLQKRYLNLALLMAESNVLRPNLLLLLLLAFMKILLRYCGAT